MLLLVGGTLDVADVVLTGVIVDIVLYVVGIGLELECSVGDIGVGIVLVG